MLNPVTNLRPIWVINGHQRAGQGCPLYLRKRTFVGALSVSAKCQKQTSPRLKPTKFASPSESATRGERVEQVTMPKARR